MISFEKHYFESVTSTMDVARDYLASHRDVHGHVFMAKTQTAGRGRHARVWTSDTGNLYATLILKPSCSLARAAQLSIVMAIAIGEALIDILPKTSHLHYKWPNDILVNQRKICGILLEADTTADQQLRGLMIGFGLNCATFPEGALWPAVSLKDLGVAVSPAEMLEKILVKVNFFYENWLSHGLTQIRLLWLERAFGKGKLVKMRMNNTELEGTLTDLSAEGALLLTHKGELLTITSGEVYFKE